MFYYLIWEQRPGKAPEVVAQCDTEEEAEEVRKEYMRKNPSEYRYTIREVDPYYQES